MRAIDTHNGAMSKKIPCLQLLIYQVKDGWQFPPIQLLTFIKLILSRFIPISTKCSN